jgi:hypothetical protein
MWEVSLADPQRESDSESAKPQRQAQQPIAEEADDEARNHRRTGETVVSALTHTSYPKSTVGHFRID